MATEKGFEAALVEARERTSLLELLIPVLRKLLLRLDTKASVKEASKLGLRVLKSFMERFRARIKLGELGEIELGVEPERGLADSGDLQSDLADVLVALAEAAASAGASICLLVDEIQYLDEAELSALIIAMHQINQRNLPLLLVAAGLPHILGLLGKSKSYAERLFAFPRVQALSMTAARDALLIPAVSRDVTFSDEALSLIYRNTEGYPYFVQQWGYETWNIALRSPITALDVEEASARAIRTLDESFFRVRFDRLTKREKDYLFAMVAVGGVQQRSGDIADQLNLKGSSVAPLRAKLIAKGMIYSPQHGDNAFTVPLFDGFLKRQLPSKQIEHRDLFF